MSRPAYTTDNQVEAFIVPLLKKEIESFIHLFNDDKGLRFLDVGCGRQPFRTLIEKRHFYQGLDYRDQVKDGSVIEMGIDDDLSKYNLEEFDVILCTEVLEHVFDPVQAFKNLSILLKEGGKLLITTPFVYPLHETPQDFWRLTPYALDRLGRNQGLILHEKKELGNAFDVLGTILGTINYVEGLEKKGVFFVRLINRIKEYLFFWFLRKGRKEWKPYSNVFLSNFVVYTK